MRRCHPAPEVVQQWASSIKVDVQSEGGHPAAQYRVISPRFSLREELSQNRFMFNEQHNKTYESLYKQYLIPAPKPRVMGPSNVDLRT